MKETTELTPAKYKLEGPIVPKRVMHRRDFGIETPLLSSILNDSLNRAFDDYVRCIGNSNYRITLNNEEQTTEDFNMLVNK
ncbi:MAG: hypothetical protein M3530_12545 [Thermoproteota archaeon]|jgi:hypothetical protein|nr:hypothetical protein [Thermoproteota archaeon]